MKNIKYKSTFSSIVLLLTIFFSMNGVVAGDSKNNRAKNRLETLFLWKISDKLELSAEKEESFISTLKDLNQKKQDAKKEMNLAVASMSKAEKNKSKSAELTKKYEESTKKYYKVHLEEIQKLRGILGDQKLAKYLVLKEELAKKLKSLLTPKGAAEFRRLATPKIIQEE